MQHPQKYKKSVLVREKLCSASMHKCYCTQRSMVKREHLCTDCTGLWQACARPSSQARNRTTRFHCWTAYARSETDLWDMVVRLWSYAGWWCHLSLIAHFGFITGAIKVRQLVWKNGPCSRRSSYFNPCISAYLKRHCLSSYKSTLYSMAATCNDFPILQRMRELHMLAWCQPC